MIRSKTDVMTLGNHEFDRGPAFLDSCISACPFPILCANVRRKADGAPVPGTKPWVLLERCGIRIGVLGLTTEYTPYMVEKSAFAPFEMTSAAEAAARHIPAMRTAGRGRRRRADAHAVLSGGGTARSRVSCRS